MTESLKKFEAKLEDKVAEAQIYKGIAVLEGAADKFTAARIQIEKFTVQLGILNATMQKAALLRLQIDAVIFKAYGVTRQAHETTYDCLGRIYGCRADQVQAYIAMRNAGSEHEEAERAALSQKLQ
jgi:hypothetical protein